MDYKKLLDVESKKVALLFELMKGYVQNERTLDELEQTLNNRKITITTSELAYVMQELADAGFTDPDMIVKMRELVELFARLRAPEKAPQNLAGDHPIRCYEQENEVLEVLLDQGNERLSEAFDPMTWLRLAEHVQEYKTHLVRKQNQLYTALERKGFDQPSRFMWHLDDRVRSNMSDFLNIALAGTESEVLPAFQKLQDACRLLIHHENLLLYPAALKLIRWNEFVKMEEGDDEIGYAFIGSPHRDESEALLMRGLESLMTHHDGIADDMRFEFGKGKLTFNQVKLILRHLPFDIAFIDEKEIVRYYNDTPLRIFPRSAGVIGRDVKKCHPPHSVATVERIIEAFRAGTQSEASFWFERGDQFIFIRYVAIRDSRDRFRGVLELTQDVAPMRALGGQKTLLDWE